MLKKIKKHISIALASIFMALSFGPGMALAQASVDQATCQGAGNLKLPDNTQTVTGTCAGFNETQNVNDVIATVINLFSIIVGVIAVIMIIYGGFRYITSGGDTAKVTASRNTILYAIIGLIVVALAQFIVKFVLEKSTDVTAS